MADPVPPDVKPGWQTSEFWLHLLVGGVLTYFLKALLDVAPTSGAPPLVIAGLQLVIPIILGFLAKSYSDGRVALKSAVAMAADAGAAGAAANTAAVLNAAK